MEHKGEYSENFIEALKERAKELHCLYQVEEILNNYRLSLPEVFAGIIRVIPAGWRFPEFCQSRILYENCSYQAPNYHTSLWTDSCSIKVDDRTVGSIEVTYFQEVPRHEEGYFLEKERKLIRTIADRIGQTILQRRTGKLLQEWELDKQELFKNEKGNNEWAAIIDLLYRIDQGMLFHICRKMIKFLFWNGFEEAKKLLQNSDSSQRNFFCFEELNRPSLKQPLDNVLDLSEKTFKIASRYMSSNEITIRLKQWITEEKVYVLLNALDRVDSSIAEIAEALNRSRNISEVMDMLYSPKERFLKVSLIRRFLSDKLGFVNIAKQYIEIRDFYEIVNRIIFPKGSQGRLGSKSAGMFLAQQILEKERDHLPALSRVKVPKTWYITTDEIIDFLHYNSLEELNEQKYRELYEIRIDYPHVIQMMKNSRFPPEIVKSLAMAVDDFGDCPLIVRSSSLLEDQEGAALSGKYKSLFLANQGNKQERLEALMDAIIEVYASVFNPDAIQYRSERGLLDFHEEMGIMVQEVVGTRIGRYYLPFFAGVAFSNNEFLWSPQIKREDGLIRLVPGLGTRAVDRLSHDFPVLISPGQPELRVNTVIDEVKQYSPKKMDVINLEENTFETIDVISLLKEYGEQIPDANLIFSSYKPDCNACYSGYDADFGMDAAVVTFEGLISRTSFIKQINLMLKTLQEKLGTPVDIEFAYDGQDLFLLQCRPQSFSRDNLVCPIPKDIDAKDIVFTANRYISNGSIQDISYIVYVDPEEYDQLYRQDKLLKVGEIVGLLNLMLPKRQFILMGPGRWGSKDDFRMGVQVSYADLNNTAALIEIGRKKPNYIPELSFGTHFFQDLVEANIRYLPLYPDDEGVVFNEKFFTKSENMLTGILPQYQDFAEVIKVIDIPRSTDGKFLRISMNAELGEAIGYLFKPPVKIPEPKKLVEYKGSYGSDEFWRWRYYMAERIAERLDPELFGVKALYLFGSANNATSGPGSDIDLLIHFDGTELQRKELLLWLNGWSLCLDEMNYLKTGYTSRGLLDIHIVTNEDIAKKTSFAIKIGAVTDPATPLKLSTCGIPDETNL